MNTESWLSSLAWDFFLNFIHHLHPAAVVTQYSPEPKERKDERTVCGHVSSAAHMMQMSCATSSQFLLRKGNNALASRTYFLLGFVEFNVYIS
jgi:hypothetical protein